jgi:hypothetical protein
LINIRKPSLKSRDVPSSHRKDRVSRWRAFACFHTSERTPRRDARVFGAHPLRDELVLKELKVRADLPREIVLGMTGAEERQEPKQEAAHARERHHSALSASVG